MNSLNKIYIVTGEKGRGKTTFLLRLIEILRNCGKGGIIKDTSPDPLLKEGESFGKFAEIDLSVGGIISPAILNEENERTGYFVQDVVTGEKKVLCTTGNITGTKTGAYYFDNQSILFGNKAIRQAITDNYSIIIVDEIGNLEINNSGWAEILNEIFVIKNKILILSIRPNLISKLIEKCEIKNPIVIYCDQFKPEELAFGIINN